MQYLKTIARTNSGCPDESIKAGVYGCILRLIVRGELTLEDVEFTKTIMEAVRENPQGLMPGTITEVI